MSYKKIKFLVTISIIARIVAVISLFWLGVYMGRHIKENGLKTVIETIWNGEENANI